ncbi:hypothetical protein ACLBX9_27880 [Methylobacterium sp. A49B]
MAAPRNGPARDQGVSVFQGAGVQYTVPMSDPDGTRPDLTGATAAWYLGAMPVGRPQGPQFYVADAPEAFTKPLPIVPDPAVPGAFMAVLAIAPQDYAGFSPLGSYQHEIWITEVGKDPYPATIGPFVIHGTVKGSTT